MESSDIEGECDTLETPCLIKCSVKSHFIHLHTFLQCTTATRCPNGNECPDGEFCYRDFVCDPPPTLPPALLATTASTVASSSVNSSSKNNSGGNKDADLASLLGLTESFTATKKPPATTDAGAATSPTPSSVEQKQPAVKEQASLTVTVSQDTEVAPIDACNLCGNSGQLDWSERVTYDNKEISCGEFGWIFLSQRIVEGSDQCLNLRSQYFGKCCYMKPAGEGCDLCDTGINGPWHDIREGVNVEYDGATISCNDLQAKVRTRLEPTSDQCINAKDDHFDDCW